MSGAAPTREVAYRVFAAEFADSTYSYAESEDDRAPRYLVTPTGARINRLFVVGVLTETEDVSDGVLRARIVDPTGAFVVYAGQYQPDALAFFERADPPIFVALTGKSRTFKPDGSDRVFTSLRPEQVNEVDAGTRDSWVVQTAEHTLERAAIMGQALEHADDDLSARLSAAGVESGLAAGIPHAIREYEPTTGYLEAVQNVALDAVRVVVGESEEITGIDFGPAEGGEGTVRAEFADVSLESVDTAHIDEATDTTETSQAEDSEGTSAEPVVIDDEEPEPESGRTEVEEASEEAEVTEEPKETESSAEPTQTESTEEPAQTDSSEGSEEGEAIEEPAEPEPSADSEQPESPPSEDEQVDSGDDQAEPAMPDAAEADTEPVETDEMYELSEAERAEVKEQYDVGFESGADIGSPEETEAIEPETTEPTADEAPSESSTDESEAAESATEEDDPDTGADSGGEPDSAERASESGDSDAAAESVATATEDAAVTEDELQNLVVDTLQELGEGDGVPRSELIETLQDRHGLDEAAIESGIEDALLGGRCFESGAEDLKPI